MMITGKGLAKDGLPMRGGVYLVRVPHEDELRKIEVYEHPIKGLSCFSEDFGSSGTGVNDETDCHVSVQRTGLEFIKWVGDLESIK